MRRWNELGITLPYYCIINQRVRHACGGLHSAKLLLYSVNFHAISRFCC
ncbi:aspartate racemase [Xanthomonas oryzae]|nr:aspartate racemase [Xanthomonas oryzae]QBG97985.1 aspartate racemase [Xanthomonas oryzae]QBH02010.1 aspartate racemase [Xanthomonas oryzae]